MQNTMSTIIKGFIKQINPIESNASGSFESQSVIVQTEEQYPQVLEVKFAQGKTEMVRSLVPGQPISVHCNVRGREWQNPQTGKMVYFLELSAWMLDAPVQQQPQQGYGQPQQPQYAPQAPEPAPAQQPQRRLQMIATDATYEQYKAANWSDDLLVAQGKAQWINTPAPAPAPAPAPQQPVQQSQQYQQPAQGYGFTPAPQYENDDLPF